MFRKSAVILIVMASGLLLVSTGCRSLFHGEESAETCREQYHEEYVGPDAGQPE